MTDSQHAFNGRYQHQFRRYSGDIITSPKKTGRIQLYIGANIGTMKIAGPDITSSTDDLSTRSIAHRFISIKLGRTTNFRTASQRAIQIQAQHIDRKGGEYLHVLGTYLQVPACTYKRTPACCTHARILACQHQCITGISGEAYKHQRDINIDKGPDRVWRANTRWKRSTGGHINTGASHMGIPTHPPEEIFSHMQAKHRHMPYMVSYTPMKMRHHS
jgi:hypothetical protein